MERVFQINFSTDHKYFDFFGEATKYFERIRSVIDLFELVIIGVEFVLILFF